MQLAPDDPERNCIVRLAIQKPCQLVQMIRPQISAQQVPKQMERRVCNGIGGVQCAEADIVERPRLAALPESVEVILVRSAPLPHPTGGNAIPETTGSQDQSNHRAIASPSCESSWASDPGERGGNCV